MSNFLYGIPVPTDYFEENMLNGHFSPSCIHAKSTKLVQFYMMQLIKDAMSVYEWEVPKTWSKTFFLRVLYLWGYVVVFDAKSEGFGVIPMNGTARGLNVFYEPKDMIVQNFALKKTYELTRGKDCECIRILPNWDGVVPIAAHYADMIALAYEAAGYNLFNSKIGYVFGAETNALAESFYKMYDKLSDGKPAVAVGKGLFNKETGEPLWMPFDANVGKNYITDKILADVAKLRSAFLTEIGITSVQVEKKERLTNDEIAASNVEAQAQSALMDEILQDSIKDVNNMFGINIKATRRENFAQVTDPKEEKEGESNEHGKA